jgi:hypothetical protein
VCDVGIGQNKDGEKQFITMDRSTSLDALRGKTTTMMPSRLVVTTSKIYLL